jgi:thiol:disulfide interchange protein
VCLFRRKEGAKMRNIINRFKIWTLFLILVAITVQASATEPGEVVKVRTAWSADCARPGDKIGLAIILDIAKGFHISPNKNQIVPSGDLNPYPTTVKIIEASEELALESVDFPPAHPVKTTQGIHLVAYEGKTVLPVRVKVSDQAKTGPLSLKFKVEYQACNTEENYCLFPDHVDAHEFLNIVPADQAVTAINQELFVGVSPQKASVSESVVSFDVFGWIFSLDANSRLGIIFLLFIAALGGFLLNLTPCVLPVIPIKIISLSKAAENRAKCMTLGLFMSLGVVVFWLGLGLVIAVITEFTATNQLFQYPAFTIAVGVIIAVMAVGMCGFFSIRLPNFVYRLNPEEESLHGSFGLGIMTAILSTPCTAPFMGAAAAWAATQRPATTLATFIAIGIGMAIPYLILSASPNLLAKMPRTGPASDLIKQVMGLFMLAAAAYFIGTGLSVLLVSPLDPPNKAYWWPVMFFCATAGCSLLYRTIRITARKGARVLFGGLGTVVLGLSILGGFFLTDSGSIDWVYYTPKRFAEAVKENKVVVMDFTAEWCLNCKALEHSVLENEKIVDLLTSEDVVPIKVDITGNNPAGKAKLKEVGRLTIPLLVVWSSSGKEVFKSDFYTVDQVIRAVHSAKKMGGALCYNHLGAKKDDLFRHPKNGFFELVQR